MSKYNEQGESTEQKLDLLESVLRAFLPDHFAFCDTDICNTGRKIHLPAPGILQP